MIIKQLLINSKEYKKEIFIKDLIVLHHTVSSGTAEAVKSWWESTPDAVATAFIIEKDGSIYRTFDERYWSWHMGPGSGIINNKRSIGIEIINEGPLVKRGDSYYWWEGKKIYKGPISTLSVPWRNELYFASYTDEQITSVTDLCKHLCKSYNILPYVIHNYTFDKKYRDHKGIVAHHNMQSYKTDVSKAFDLSKLSRDLNVV